MSVSVLISGGDSNLRLLPNIPPAGELKGCG